MDFKDKVVIVTGASSGIGAATAKRFAELGAKVLCGYSKNKEGAEKTVKNCIGLSGEAFSFKADISNEEDRKNLVKNCVKIWGKIDILVNSAGISNNNIDEVLSVNFVGPYELIKLTEKYLQLSKNPVIINISSIAGIAALGRNIGYLGSKSALNAMTISLARSLGSYGIRVNSICPGFVETEWWNNRLNGKTILEIKDNEIKKIPLARIAKVEDIVEPIIFLASNRSRHITGQIISIDGGALLGTL